jgi:hypothetical protein
LAFAYVDFEGTKYGAHVDPRYSTWPHIHAVMFVRPQHEVEFNLLVLRWKAHFERGEPPPLLPPPELPYDGV